MADDPKVAVVNCLRALSKYSQRTSNDNIPWGGTKDSDLENVTALGSGSPRLTIGRCSARN